MKKKIEAEDFLEYTFLSAPAFSPDASHAAFLEHGADIETNGYYSRIMVIDDLNDPIPRALTDEKSCIGFLWEDNEHIWQFAGAKGGSKISRISVCDNICLDCFEIPYRAKPLTILNDGRIAFLAQSSISDERRLLEKHGDARILEEQAIAQEKNYFTIVDEYPFWMNGEGFINKIRCGLYFLEPQGRQCMRATPEYFHVENAAYSSKLNLMLLAGSEYEIIRPYKTGISVLDVSNTALRSLIPKDEYRVEHIGFMGKTAVFVGSKLDIYNVSQCPEIFSLDLSNGRTETLYHGEISVHNSVCGDCRYGSGKEFSGKEKTLMFVSSVEDSSHIISWSTDTGLEPLVEYSGSVDCFDASERGVLFVGMHDMRLQELYLQTADGEKHRLTSCNETYYETHAISVPKKLFYKNAQGSTIHGFVLEPIDFDSSKDYPLILCIHGGPRLSYGEIFYHEMQYLANHGYIVAYANPTGSDGFGQQFGYLCGKFGTVDYDDLMQFTDELLKAYPCIDESRMGVMGGSYGGFMTNWIIGHTDRFAAVVSQRSISNFISLEGTSDYGIVLSEGQQLAGTFHDIEKTWWHSPLKYAHNVKTPTLFIQAMQDYRCPVSEAMQMYTALKMNGTKTRMCLFYGENHDLSRTGKPRSRLKRIQEITAWMDEFLFPQRT